MEMVMTGIGLREAVQLDPAWASKLTAPVKIIGDAGLTDSPITHLSPHLHFEEAAYLQRCRNLKVAEGHFGNWVDFEGSGIEEIGELEIAGSKAKMCCDLSFTPLAKKNPILAAKIMTKSDDPEKWEEACREAQKYGWTGTADCLKSGIRLVRQKKMISTLRRQGNPLEI
jgi:hypothetical protein